MSRNTGRTPRHDPAGRYTHECVRCGVTFKDNRPTTRYCCFEHKMQQNNRNFYRRHRTRIILAVRHNQAQQVKPKRKRKAQTRRTHQVKPTVNFDTMSNDELLDYFSNHPGEITGAKPA